MENLIEYLGPDAEQGITSLILLMLFVAAFFSAVLAFGGPRH